MDRVRARAGGDIQNFVDIEIRLGGRRGTDRISLIGLANVQSGAIDIGVDCHRGNSHLVAGADHAHGNLAPVRDENLLEHETAWGRADSRAHLTRPTRYCNGPQRVRAAHRGGSGLLRITTRIRASLQPCRQGREAKPASAAGMPASLQGLKPASANV